MPPVIVFGLTWLLGILAVTIYLAGHDQPILVRANGAVAPAGKWGTALGVVARVHCPPQRLTLHPGDALVFFTDGVTEHRNGITVASDGQLKPLTLSTAQQVAPTLDPEVQAQIRETLDGFAGRVGAYMEKATKEAKRHTSWINPNPAYDAGRMGADQAAARCGARVVHFVPDKTTDKWGLKLDSPSGLERVTLDQIGASLVETYAKQTGLAIFLAYLVPPSILFIPLATIVFKLGLFDTRWALILTYPTFLIPFCTWLLMGYFRSIPYELEECALIDGATRFEILVKIILPLSVPGLISAGIFAFTLSWNEFIYALTFVSSSEIKTVPVGVVTELVEGDVYHWGSLMAGALLGSLPVAVMYSFFVEHYVSGMTGAVKE